MGEEKEKIVKINIPDELKVPEHANTFRVKYTDSEFLLEFGVWNETDNYREVNVVSRVTIPKEKLSSFIAFLYRAGKAFEKEFDEDLGIKQMVTLKKKG